jgi:hypothetical protein
MRSTSARVAIGVATLAAVAVLFVVFAGDDDEGDDTSATTTTTQAQTQTSATNETTPTREEPDVAADQQITVRNGRPVGGVKELSFDSGDRVRFIVTSNVADEVHVHGYDITRDVRPGRSTRFSFPARLEGVFEVELHDAERQIAELRVSP